MHVTVRTLYLMYSKGRTRAAWHAPNSWHKSRDLFKHVTRCLFSIASRYYAPSCLLVVVRSLHTLRSYSEPRSNIGMATVWLPSDSIFVGSCAFLPDLSVICWERFLFFSVYSLFCFLQMLLITVKSCFKMAFSFLSFPNYLGSWNKPFPVNSWN